jgi:histidinol phosphatase-like PHP family hydrolase
VSERANASWRPRDCHAHTTHSDGQLTPAQLVARAESLGVLPGIADHLSRDVQSAVKSPDAVRAYLDDLEQYPTALRGGEFCWHDSLWRELPDDAVRRMTHRVGSLHAARMADGTWVHMFQRRLPSGLTPQAYMDAHVASLEAMMAEMPVDVFAHPTLLPLEYRKLPLEELWTEEREERAVAAMRRAGVAMEISNRYRPHERLVRRAADAGVRLSLGSDGHTLGQVADVAWPLALARSLGVKDEALYDPTVHGSRTREPGAGSR